VKLRIAEERLVVISDLHLGSPASTAHRDLLHFLDEVAESGRALCINGDGFDLLQSSGAALATRGFPVLRRLQELQAVGVPIYYVLGNHDLALEHVLFDLPFTVAPFFNLTSGERLIRLEHGHLHEPFYVRYPGLYELGGRLGRAALMANADSYEWWARAQQRVDDRRRSDERTYPHHAAAIDLFRRGFDAVVFGHTHQPEVAELDGGTFVNGGDWLRRRTMVTIDHGRLALDEWRPGRLLESAVRGE
jgi:UDP-2,3-diacylglucosamine pyrophosphatase LpxH